MTILPAANKNNVSVASAKFIEYLVTNICPTLKKKKNCLG